MTPIRITDDPRLPLLERSSCSQCRHYGNAEAPDCVLLACLFADGHAPGFEVTPKRLVCRGWESKYSTAAVFASGQMTFDGETDHRCGICGRWRREPGVHTGCQQRAERHDQLTKLAAEQLGGSTRRNSQ